jgi:8-oxo-dGTP diphosphatase
MKPITPLATVDIIIELPAGIVLIERRHEPAGWALPGGFVDVGEPPERAAVREAKEETGLDVELLELLGVYGDPARDPRGHTISTAYVARASGQPLGSDDAARAIVVPPTELPSPLAFDHARIIADYRRWKADPRTYWRLGGGR